MMYFILVVVICVVVGLWRQHIRKQKYNREKELSNSASAEGRIAGNEGREESECPYNDGDGTDPRNVPLGVLGVTQDGEPFRGQRFWWIAGYRQGLKDRSKSSPQPGNIGSSSAAKEDPSSDVRPSVGVLFDIDHLGATPEEHMFYGLQARRIFMKCFHPRMASPAVLWAGDTQRTLDGLENRFCIAITAKASDLESVVGAFSRLSDAGLVSAQERFCQHPVDLDVSAGSPRAIHREPLPMWLSIDEHGVVILPEPINAEDVQLCRQHHWRLMAHGIK